MMKKGPWFNLNHMLSLQKWKQEVPVTEVDFKWVPFWVQLHGLPLGVMTEKNASKIVEQIGQPLEVEDSRVEGCILRGFIIVRVLVNVQKPLLTGCWIPRENLPRVWVVFKYEKLQGFCYNCGILGHEQMNCSRSKVMSVLCKEIPRYGPKLGVNATKPFWVLANEFDRWRRDSQPFGENFTNKTDESSSNTRNEGLEEREVNQGRVVLEVEDDGTTEQAAQEKGEVTSNQVQGDSLDREVSKADKTGEKGIEEEKSSIAGAWVCRHSPGSRIPTIEKARTHNTLWPNGFLQFLSLLDEPNIFSGTHVMEEHSVGTTPSKGPTLDVVADYIADFVRKRQGDSLEEKDGYTKPTTKVTAETPSDVREATGSKKGFTVEEVNCEKVKIGSGKNIESVVQEACEESGLKHCNPEQEYEGPKLKPLELNRGEAGSVPKGPSEEDSKWSVSGSEEAGKKGI